MTREHGALLIPTPIGGDGEQVAGTYYETRVNGYNSPGGSHSTSTFDYYYSYICFFTGTQETTTLSYSSSITINQSTGAVSLASPTTVTINATDYTTSQLGSMFAGKYVKGLMPATTAIFYIPLSAYVYNDTWQSGEDWRYYTGFLSTNDPGRIKTDVKVVGSAYSESIGAWEARFLAE